MMLYVDAMEMDDEGLGDVDSEDKIVLNVGGVTHETLVSTLAKKPGTRLSELAKQHERGEGTETEYYFSRHPRVFNTVIDYYRSGRWTVAGRAATLMGSNISLDSSLLRNCVY